MSLTNLSYEQTDVITEVRDLDSLGDKAIFDQVNVKDYGAVCDGVTDDTEAIQTAMDSLVNGGFLVYPEGLTIKQGSIDMLDGVVADGRNCTLIPADGPTELFLSETEYGVTRKDGIGVKNFNVMGDCTNVVRVTGSGWRNIHFENINIISGTGISIIKTEIESSANPSGLTIRNLNSRQNSNGFKYGWYSTGESQSDSIDSVNVNDIYIWCSANGYSCYIDHVISTNSKFDNLYHGAGGGVGGGVLHIYQMVRGIIGKLWAEASNGDISMITGSYRDLNIERLVMQTNTATESDVSKFMKGHFFNVNVGKCILQDDNGAGYERDDTPPDSYICFDFEEDTSSHISRDVRIDNVKGNYDSTHISLGTAENISYVGYDPHRGSFTPEIADEATAGNVASGTIRGQYWKSGNMVTLAISIINLDTTGLTSGNPIYIRNLPYACSAVSGSVYFTGAVLSDSVTLSANALNMVSAILDGQDYIRLYENIDGGSDGIVRVSAISSGVSDISFSLSYFTD